MGALNVSAGRSIPHAGKQSPTKVQEKSFRCGFVQMANSMGMAPALGYLALAFAEGNDLFGYRLKGKQYKVALLSSPKRAALIRKKLKQPIARLAARGCSLKIIDSNVLASCGAKLSDRDISNRLDKALCGSEVVIVDGLGMPDISDKGSGFAPAGYETPVASYFFASIREYFRTIIFGLGYSFDPFKEGKRTDAFDHVISAFRFDKQREPVSFLTHWMLGSSRRSGEHELLINRRVKRRPGFSDWQLDEGPDVEDPLMQFAIHLRCLGMTYQGIGDLLGRGRTTVHRWLVSDSQTSPHKSH